MQKGQISLDLLITLIAAIVAVIALSAIVFSYMETNERSVIQQQLQYNANKTASAITAAQALDDTNFSIKLQVGKVYYNDENKQYKNVYPTIIDNSLENSLSFEITFDGQTQTASAKYYKSPETNIIINNVTKPGTVVINHES